MCDRCEVRWGHKPGCSWPENEDDTKAPEVDEDGNVIIDEMKTNDYDEAHNPVIIEEMAEERQAAEAKAAPVPTLGTLPSGTDVNTQNMSTDELL